MKRRSKRKTRLIEWSDIALSGFKFMHNFLKAHWRHSVRTSKNWIKTPVTPAMAAEIITVQPSIEAILKVKISTL